MARSFFGDTSSGSSTEIPLNRDVPEGKIKMSPNPDSKLLVAGSLHGLQGWNTGTRQQVMDMPEAGEIDDLAFSPDGRLLASTSTVRDRTLEASYSLTFWDTTSWKRIGESIPLRYPIVFVSFSSGGKTLVAGDYYGITTFWNVEQRQQTGQPLEEPGHGLDFSYHGALWFSPDDKQLFSCTGAEQPLLAWDLGSHPPISRTLVSSSDPYSTMAFNAERMQFAWNTRSNARLIVRNPISDRRVKIDCSWADNLVFSPDGNVLAATCAPLEVGTAPTIYLFDVGNP
jgi:WD40 repeat protein